MKFKFYPTISRLYDFLIFPRVLFYKEAYEKSKEEDFYNEITMNEYLEFINKAEDRLKPFIKEIELFYAKPFITDYNFIDLITRTYGIFDYTDEREFLDSLLTLSAEDINKNIIASLLVINEDYECYSDLVVKEAERIYNSENGIISFIKSLTIESGLKWNLFLIAEDPVKYAKKYVELMLQVLPIFYEFYNPLEDDINAYGNYLVDYLNKNGPKGLGELTDSIVDARIFKTDEIKIMVSIVFSYAISLFTKGKDNYIAWGIKMEDAFRQIKEISENKTNERVQIFKNLGDKTRYEVLKLIASGERSTKIIAETLGVSSATVSYHINNFLTSKVIKMDKINDKFGYVVDYELLNRTLEEFKEDLRFPQKNG